jgi:hypothetical protein
MLRLVDGVRAVFGVAVRVCWRMVLMLRLVEGVRTMFGVTVRVCWRMVLMLRLAEGVREVTGLRDRTELVADRLMETLLRDVCILLRLVCNRLLSEFLVLAMLCDSLLLPVVDLEAVARCAAAREAAARAAWLEPELDDRELLLLRELRSV